MCCSVLRVVRSKGYLSIPLNISGALFWKCTSPDDKSKFNPHIYHPQLAIAVHACRVRRKEGNYEEIKWRAIVRCPSTGQNNTEWQEMKECQNAATKLLFAPNGFPVEANIKKCSVENAYNVRWADIRLAAATRCSGLLSASPVPFICSNVLRSVSSIYKSMWDEIWIECKEPAYKHNIL